MDQHLVTIVIPFQDRLAAVEQELTNTWGNPLRPALSQELDRLGLIHFMGIHALGGEDGHRQHLVIELALDGSAELAIARLASALGEPLQRLFESAGLGELAAAQDSDRARLMTRFLRRHQLQEGLGWFDPIGLGFSGAPGFSVARIRAEAALAERISAMLETIWSTWPPLEKLKHVRAELWRADAQKWAFEEEPCLSDQGEGGEVAAVIKSLGPLARDLLWPLAVPPALGFGAGWVFGGPLAAVGAATLVLAIEAGLVALLYRRFRAQEDGDSEDFERADSATMAEILQREDHLAQNHLIVLTPLKAGRLREFSLRVAFFAIRQAVQHLFAPGELSDIGTIHFARWLVLPRSRQLLFMSNYGGSWESYLEDFIIKAHAGLTAVWSNTLGFPKAKNLFFDGATHGARFKRWARSYQRPTRCWYSAYPTLTTARIRTNAAIRQGVAAARSEADAANWLARFGASRPATDPAIELDKVPPLVFSGLARLRHGKSLLLRFADEAQAKAWLVAVTPLVSFGPTQAETEQVVSLGFSKQGLLKLGLADAIATFPVAFQHDSALRARTLGDSDRDAPAHWDWGGNENNAVDVIALLYAKTESGLEQLTKRVEPTSCAFRQTVHFKTRSASGTLQREPFGFVDGISQPILRGTSKANGKRRDQLLAAGEVVLGYSDESSFLPDSPTLPEQSDPENLLPSANDQSGRRDFGRNGTFLVVRQLRQDVQAFDKFLDESAQFPAFRDVTPDGADAREWIAAKMIGRWRNGTSLVRNPSGPGAGDDPDNDFRFGVEDPDGISCPLGSHIRRANPRDSFDPNSEDSLKVINRHRILRVGRSYVSAGESKSNGLMFMCLNADIERQFEFIQQTWVRAPSFHGLSNEVDPLAARASTTQTREPFMTIPTADGPVLLKGFKDFVRLLGSGYFFMPGQDSLRYLAKRAQADRSQPWSHAAE
jgi:deferrochelatase/peroxidase EfeB